MKAVWHDATLAESQETIVIEGNHYFPPASIHQEYFHASDTHTACPWKGQASYYHVKVNDELNADAAWCYPAPKEGVKQIRDYVAFWKGVKIVA